MVVHGDGGYGRTSSGEGDRSRSWLVVLMGDGGDARIVVVKVYKGDVCGGWW